eukprot:TRINITY_DN5141_c0_g2_i1.p2 TRINITY_DN5141_c0_g2~~TRINITY_DN5141_c0_g2_i1.p2  ORF type:complete len:113 (+),score=22.87 TRINITY_DN5141_c0_g2_i1:923-1261(+)
MLTVYEHPLAEPLVFRILKDLSSWGCGMVGLASEDERKAEEQRKRHHHIHSALAILVLQIEGKKSQDLILPSFYLFIEISVSRGGKVGHFDELANRGGGVITLATKTGKACQ